MQAASGSWSQNISRELRQKVSHINISWELCKKVSALVSTLFQLKLQDGGSDGCLCWEPPLCVGDQQPCAKGPRPLLHQVGQASRPITITLFFARKQPFEEKPKLAAELAKPLHSLVMSMNTHPVRWVFCHTNTQIQKHNHVKWVFHHVSSFDRILLKVNAIWA